MPDTALTALSAELRSDPPAGLARLNPDELEDLTAAIRDARKRQAAEIDAAGNRALGFIPRLLRGPVRKVVGA